jgi:fructokinase
MNTTTRFSVGVDLGGTKTELVVLAHQPDLDDSVIHRERVTTPNTSYNDILDTIETLFRQAEATLSLAWGQTIRFTHLGVGAPGTTIPETGLIKNANTTCLIGQPLQADLSQRLNIPVRVENDANCFTLSEATDGAAKAKKVVFGVILGTGVGGGLCINGQLLNGHHGIAGEWGHNPLPRGAKETSEWFDAYPPRACYCGLHDCIETYLSGPGFVKTYSDHVNASPLSLQKQHPSNLQLRQAHSKLSAIDVIALSQAGNALAIEALSQYAQQLARSLAAVVNMIDPDAIVLGGGMSNVQALYPLVKQAIPHDVFTDDFDTPILQAKFGDSSGVRGAAWLGAPQKIVAP